MGDVLLCVIEDKTFPEHADITNKFVKDVDLNMVGDKARGMEYQMNPTEKIISAYCYLGKKPIRYAFALKRYIYELNDYMVFDYGTVPGDCGAIFCLEGDKFEARPLAGMHTAGSPVYKVGYCQLVTQEDLAKGFEIIEKEMRCNAEPQSKLDDITLPEKCHYIGKTPPGEDVYLPGKTQIRRSRVSFEVLRNL
jgi:hypothetical protein